MNIFFIGKNVKSSAFVGRELQNIFGIGFTQAKNICSVFGLTLQTTFNMLPKSRLQKIEKYCFSKQYFGKLYQRKYFFSLQFQKKVGALRGRRLVLGLPVRGQRTHTNASTSKKLNGKI